MPQGNALENAGILTLLLCEIFEMLLLFYLCCDYALICKLVCRYELLIIEVFAHTLTRNGIGNANPNFNEIIGT